MMLPAEPKKKKIRNWLIAVVVILLYIWAFAGVPFAGVKENVGQIVGSIFYGLIHPDWGYVYTGDGEDLISLMIETVAIAFVGTSSFGSMVGKTPNSLIISCCMVIETPPLIF